MPFVTSKNPQTTRILVNKLLAALTVTPAGPLAPTDWDIRLYTAGPVNITPDVEFADFTEADFNGYVQTPITLSAPFEMPSGDGNARAGTALFVATNGLVPNTVLGYFVTDDDSDVVIAEAFDSPIPIANTGDFISLDAVFGIPWVANIGS